MRRRATFVVLVLAAWIGLGPVQALAACQDPCAQDEPSGACPDDGSCCSCCSCCAQARAAVAAAPPLLRAALAATAAPERDAAAAASALPRDILHVPKAR
jgi:hypothetical protein